MIELKPCPYCGSTDVHIFTVHETCYVMCYDCLMKSPRRKGKRNTAAAWNTLPRHLRWTKEPPTDSGWYWFRNLSAKGTRYLPQIVHTIELKERNPHPDDEWSGPLEMPLDDKRSAE